MRSSFSRIGAQHLAERRIDDPVDQKQRRQHDDEDEHIHVHLMAEIDQAEQPPARHRLDAVLAAGEFHPQRHEIHHLRQRQRDHGEIDALAADGDDAGDDAKARGGRRAGQDRQLRRQAPGLGGIGCEIARPAEIKRMTERQQPDIAEQQIEGAGEQRKAQRLHQKDRIEHVTARRSGTRPARRRRRQGCAACRAGLRCWRFLDEVSAALAIRRPARTGRPAAPAGPGS